MRKVKRHRGGVGLLAIFTFVIGAHAAAACNDTPLRYFEPCRGLGCTCEADPSQPLCRGFNERPEGSPGFDAGIVEASDDVFEPGDGSDDAADAEEDADGA